MYGKITNPVNKNIQYYKTDNLIEYLNNRTSRLFVCNSGLVFYNENIVSGQISHNTRAIYKQYTDDFEIIGTIHCNFGKAIILPNDDDDDYFCDYYVNGINYDNKMEWFAALTPEEKYDAMWAM